MKNEKKQNNYMFYGLYVCLFANVPLSCFITINESYQDLSYITIGILAIIFIANLVGVIVLTYHCNARIQSEKNENDTKLQQIVQEFKNVKYELERLSNRSSITNDNMYRTIEIIAETLSDKNCDDPKLKTFKDIINAILSHKAEWQAR